MLFCTGPPENCTVTTTLCSSREFTPSIYCYFNIIFNEYINLSQRGVGTTAVLNKGSSCIKSQLFPRSARSGHCTLRCCCCVTHTSTAIGTLKMTAAFCCNAQNCVALPKWLGMAMLALSSYMHAMHHHSSHRPGQDWPHNGLVDTQIAHTILSSVPCNNTFLAAACHVTTRFWWLRAITAWRSHALAREPTKPAGHMMPRARTALPRRLMQRQSKRTPGSGCA